MQNGLLLVDKPAGVTSHDVVAVARRALGERRIGHAGTLDPFATGLLVLLVGRATRLLPHVSGDPKVYEATIRFGSETTTEDLHGDETVTAPLPSVESLLVAVGAVLGPIDQIPPAFSAKRVGGRRAHELARAGQPVALAPVSVRVDKWELLAMRGFPPTTLTDIDAQITCGPGTYVRSLARDLARAAGSAAHLTALRRTRSGAFDVADAVTLDAIRDGVVPLLPPIAAIPDYPVQALDPADVRRVTSGIEVDASVDGAWGALTDTGGALVALAERRDDRWQPRVVLSEAS